MRDPNTTKQDYGHALIIAGAYGRCGCAILAARAALRSGCGLLTVHLPNRCVDTLQAAIPEAMADIDPHPDRYTTPPGNLHYYTALATGPGLGTHPDTAQALHGLLLHRPEGCPLVLDADALNILAMHRQWLSLCRGAVFTPHAREYERLFGTASPAETARAEGVILVCKAHRTRIYAPDGRLCENTTGNAGMATAGSGDVLTGMLAGLLAQLPSGTDPFPTVCQAVHWHGQAADLYTAHHSESSLIASDLVESLRELTLEPSATLQP